MHGCLSFLRFPAAEFTVSQAKGQNREEMEGCLWLRVERSRRRAGGALSLQGPGKQGAAIGLGLIPGARCVPSLFNLRIENPTRVGPRLSLAFTHSLDKC